MPTPEGILEEIKQEFEDDFELTLQSVKRFMQNYPDLIAEFQNAAKGEVDQPAEAAHA